MPVWRREANGNGGRGDVEGMLLQTWPSWPESIVDDGKTNQDGWDLPPKLVASPMGSKSCVAFYGLAFSSMRCNELAWARPPFSGQFGWGAPGPAQEKSRSRHTSKPVNSDLTSLKTETTARQNQPSTSCPGTSYQSGRSASPSPVHLQSMANERAGKSCAEFRIVCWEYSPITRLAYPLPASVCMCSSGTIHIGESAWSIHGTLALNLYSRYTSDALAIMPSRPLCVLSCPSSPAREFCLTLFTHRFWNCQTPAWNCIRTAQEHYALTTCRRYYILVSSQMSS